MINVVFDRNDDNSIHTFTMDGHADFAEHGKDLVCAGASAVSFGAVNAIAAICDVRLDVEMKGDGGFLRCRVPEKLDSSTYEKVQLLLEGLFYSLKTLEEQYGQFITIKN
ncbi:MULTISPECIES: ribosomal-processing cysteine protease Prp [Bacillaceae]|uniref:Ribosomal processing cysteine protease Prp n=1 Tax=Evansella alkalicola TaxID=745819 RepID=A0ABS6JTJ7_9BACI|nr:MULTISPECIES: ribosomal-processing cysteine protease Prp [Bacillaceae]MBU9721895.1 ribosomal-processing cysteine protease Prp [Bacillus alkalicola]